MDLCARKSHLALFTTVSAGAETRGRPSPQVAIRPTSCSSSMDWRKLREADAKLKEVSEPTRSKVFNWYNTVDGVEEDVIMDSESKDIKPRDRAVDLENFMKGPGEA